MSAASFLRTPKVLAGYRKAVAKGPADVRKFPFVDEFTHWILVENEYPYDIIASQHHMLTPKRDNVANEQELNLEELMELALLKDRWTDEHTYDMISLNFPKARSLPNQLHYHLLTFHRS